MRPRSYLAGVLVVVLVGLVAGTASAETPELYDWPVDRAPVLVRTEGGLIFLGDDAKPWRAYSWNESEGEKHDPVHIVDIDNDDEPEIVGAGSPTFAIETNGNPSWSLEEGCDQVVLANFVSRDNLGVLCRKGDEVAIHTHDLQKVWSAELGVELDWCRASDINGDLKSDVECKYAGRKSFIRIDAKGDILAQSAKEPEMDDSAEHDEVAPYDAATLLKGEKEFDLNGDGAVEESMVVDGSAVVFQSRSKKKAVARAELDGEPKSAYVENLDGEGGLEVVVVTDQTLYVIDSKGKISGEYSVDAGDYERYPVAKLSSVYARGFGDNAAAQKKVEKHQDALADCYADRVAGNLFVGIGQVLLKVHVDGEGAVQRVEKMHSAIRDEEVESCATDVLEGIDYPGAKGGEDAEATVNVNMKFTFADREE
ncbi:MAG: AgmX/PglI C-terminal domain-containing protein [Bradymonadaceae bacterium]